LWTVAENWRYEAAFVQAADLVRRGDIGEPLLCHWASYYHIVPDNKYYQTPWRRSGSFQGGYLLDGGVHRAAALRLILGELAEVYAIKEQLRPDLPPVDTLCATLRFDNGVVGSYSMTVAVHPPWNRSLSIVGREGSLQVERWEVAIERGGQTESIPIARQGDVSAIEAEFAAFAAAIRQGTATRNTPRQALQDLAVVEAMLLSARTGQRVVPERIV
jgi:predicted dehydrogenase